LKILILKPSSLGDVIQALPVLRLLKLHLPKSEIYWWIDSALAPLIEGDPDLAGLLLFERKRWGHPQHWPEMIRSIRRMRQQQFDWVIDLQCLARSAAFAWLADGQRLIGLDEVREGARGFYDQAVRRASFHTHAVDWYLAVLKPLGVPVHHRFTWLPERPDHAAALQAKWPLTPARWIALQPGARWDNKRWPADSFSEVVRTLAREIPEVRFAILGGRDDQAVGQSIALAAPGNCLNLCGQTTLPEMIEWVRRCELMVTNDTGPMHVAAALGKPIVALFGPTEPRRTGPYGQTEDVLRLPHLPCSPCMTDHCTYSRPNECLKGIAPQAVLERVRQIMAGGAGPANFVNPQGCQTVAGGRAPATPPGPSPETECTPEG
jgi:lipopolysaccharide heptosyltransferase II